MVEYNTINSPAPIRERSYLASLMNDEGRFKERSSHKKSKSLMIDRNQWNSRWNALNGVKKVLLRSSMKPPHKRKLL
jgi:hypothetical protein